MTLNQSLTAGWRGRAAAARVDGSGPSRTGDTMRRFAGLLAILFLFALARPAPAEDQWMTLPPTPSLPKAVKSGLAEINGIKIWFAEFGPANGKPVLLLHG